MQENIESNYHRVIVRDRENTNSCSHKIGCKSFNCNTQICRERIKKNVILLINN